MSIEWCADKEQKINEFNTCEETSLDCKNCLFDNSSTHINNKETYNKVICDCKSVEKNDDEVYVQYEDVDDVECESLHSKDSDYYLAYTVDSPQEIIKESGIKLVMSGKGVDSRGILGIPCIAKISQLCFKKN